MDAKRRFLTEEELTYWVLVAALVALVIYILNRVVDAMATITPQPPASSHCATYGTVYRHTVLPCCIALVLAWLVAGTPLPAFLDHRVAYDQWLEDPVSRLTYQWKDLEGTNDEQMRTPLPECTHYASGQVLQDELLPSLDELVPIHAGNDELSTDPLLARKMRARWDELEDVRIKALKRCIFNGARHVYTIVNDFAYLSDDSTPSILHILGTLPGNAKSDALAMGPVRDVLIGRDRSWYFRVMALVPERPSKGGSDKKAAMHVVLEPRLLNVETILQYAMTWVKSLQPRAQTIIKANPCLPVEFMGIIHSGLYLTYDMPTETKSLPTFADRDSEDAARVGKWHLRLDPTYVTGSFGGEVWGKNMSYLKFLGPFPAKIHEKLKLDSYMYPERSRIEFIDMATVLAGPAGDARIEQMETWWIKEGGPTTTNTRTDMMLRAFAIEEIAQGAQGRVELGEDANECLAYARRVATHVEEALKKG